MRNINPVFTEEEFEKVERIKKLLKMSWHDFILKIVEMAEKEIVKQLKNEGKTDEEIKKLMGG